MIPEIERLLVGGVNRGPDTSEVISIGWLVMGDR